MSNLSLCKGCKFSLVFGDNEHAGLDTYCLVATPSIRIDEHIADCNRYEAKK